MSSMQRGGKRRVIRALLHLCGSILANHGRPWLSRLPVIFSDDRITGLLNSYVLNPLLRHQQRLADLGQMDVGSIPLTLRGQKASFIN